jgi:hypothetical protein
MLCLYDTTACFFPVRRITPLLLVTTPKLTVLLAYLKTSIRFELII